MSIKHIFQQPAKNADSRKTSSEPTTPVGQQRCHLGRPEFAGWTPFTMSALRRGMLGKLLSRTTSRQLKAQSPALSGTSSDGHRNPQFGLRATSALAEKDGASKLKRPVKPLRDQILEKSNRHERSLTLCALREVTRGVEERLNIPPKWRATIAHDVDFLETIFGESLYAIFDSAAQEIAAGEPSYSDMRYAAHVLAQATLHLLTEVYGEHFELAQNNRIRTLIFDRGQDIVKKTY